MTFLPAPRTAMFVLALLVTWVVWGSSFVAITFALDSLPPLLLMASRFIVAGAITTMVGLALAVRRGQPLPGRGEWGAAGLIGIGFVTIGMGATGWSATRLPTGIASLLVASAPLWITVFRLLGRRESRPGRIALAGVAVGMVGVGILVAPGGGSGSIDAFAALVLVAANAAWAAASLFAQRASRPDGLALGVGMQMLTGGMTLLAVALLAGEGARVELGSVGSLAAAGWAYLVLPAAIGGFLSYGWLLANVSAGIASTHAFVNPLVAVALGAMVLGEQVDERTLMAGGAVVLAVVLLLVGETRAAGAQAQAQAQAQADTPRAARPGRPTASLPQRYGRRDWSPAPTPAFARRTPRPWHATDGMDALDIDAALDRPFDERP